MEEDTVGTEFMSARKNSNSSAFPHPAGWCRYRRYYSRVRLRFGLKPLPSYGDVVEESNLNRQNYRMQDIGKPKAEALKEHLLVSIQMLTLRNKYIHRCRQCGRTG